MGLTVKQKLFVDEYFNTNFNGTKAAINSGYSEKTAYAIASENLRKPEIIQEVDKRLKERQLSADMVLARLSEMALSNISDFAHVETQSDLAKLQNGYLIKKFKKRYYRKDDYEEVELELYDAQSPLINIGKQLGLFSDRHILEVKLEKEMDSILAILQETLSPDEFERVVSRLTSSQASGSEVATE